MNGNVNFVDIISNSNMYNYNGNRHISSINNNDNIDRDVSKYIAAST